MNAADTFDVRPKLRQDTVFLPWGDGAYLRTAETAAQLDGASTYRLLSRLSPYLNGERTLEQICAGLGGAQRAAVGALVGGLLDRGFVIDAGRRAELEPAVAARFRAQLAYLDHLGTGAAPRFTRFRTARVLLAGNGASLHAAATGLLRNGAACLDIAPDTADWPHRHAVLTEAERLRGDGVRTSLRIVPDLDPGAGYDLVLYCADRGGAEPVAELNRRCQVGGPPLVPMLTVGGWGLLGPVVRPGTAGCWWCAWRRLAESVPVAGGEPVTPTVARMLGGAAAFEAFRLLTGALPADTDGAVVVQELRTLESTRVGVPPDGCPVCAGPAAARSVRGHLAPLRAGTPAADRIVGDPLPEPAPPDARIARDYAEAAYRLVREPMEPAGFIPNWPDQPAAHKTYPDAPMVALPDRPPPERPLAEARAPAAGEYTMDSLAWLLRMSYGVLSRRLRVDWNHVSTVRTRYSTAFWSRGTVSGGGLYPLEIYWVAGAGGPLPPGVYHYATGHHALERLTGTDITDRVRAAVHQHPDAVRTGQFLVVSLRFRRNTFKYANLGYHVSTLDVGALLGSWDLLGAGLGVPARRLLWFDDAAMNSLLGLETAEESVLAVVPLPWVAAPAGHRVGPTAAEPPVPFERSRTALRFPRVERVHRATLVAGKPRPGRDAARAARVSPSCGAAVELPRPGTDHLTEPVSALLARRRSSSGGLAAVPALRLDQLGTVLELAARAGHYRGDLAPDAEPAGWTRLSVLANHVAGLASGGYRYDPAGHALHRVEPGVPDPEWPAFLRRVGMALMNYNLDQAAAVLVISGRLDALLAGYGARGYRLLNAEAGTVAQAGYLAATALRIGCGAVLNLDNLAVNEALGFTGTDERSVLFLLIGGDRDGRADLDYRLAE